MCGKKTCLIFQMTQCTMHSTCTCTIFQVYYAQLSILKYLLKSRPIYKQVLGLGKPQVSLSLPSPPYFPLTSFPSPHPLAFPHLLHLPHFLPLFSPLSLPFTSFPSPNTFLWIYHKFIFSKRVCKRWSSVLRKAAPVIMKRIASSQSVFGPVGIWYKAFMLWEK